MGTTKVLIPLKAATIIVIAAAMALAMPMAAWAANFVGTNGDDIIDGTPEDDFINGRGGNDQLNGLEGNDEIKGGDGDDVIDGGEGRNKISGGGGDDHLENTFEASTLHGGKGDDMFTSKRDGSESIFIGGPGADNFLCGVGIDTVQDFNPDEGDTVSEADCENF